MLQLLGKIEKELRVMNFKVERASKNKYTLSTLLSRTSEDLEKSSELVKKIFGRYLSTEVMKSLLEDPLALELGGEHRKVIIMMTDLKMKLGDVDEKLAANDFYGKVIERLGEKGLTDVVRFTSLPAEVDAYFRPHGQYAAKPAAS
jgi:hypothetical protein